MAIIDLESLSLKELKELEKGAAKAIKIFEARRLKEARAAAEAAVREFGVSLDEVMAAKGARKTAAKYQNPENPDLTWSGLGRKPGWFLAAIEGGTSAENLFIAQRDR